MSPLAEVTRIFIGPAPQISSRNYRLTELRQRRRPGLEVSRAPPRHLQLGSESGGADYKSFPPAGALRNASPRGTPLVSIVSSHTHTDMSTHTPIEQSSQSAVPENRGSNPSLMTCPTDGQILETHHKQNDDAVECPHCTQVWDLEEVANVAN